MKSFCFTADEEELFSITCYGTHSYGEPDDPLGTKVMESAKM